MIRCRPVFLFCSAVIMAAALPALAADPKAAQPRAFAAGDAESGKTLNDKDCVGCHARRFDGNADAIYLREDHKVRTPEQLMAQITYCNTQLSTNYFPEEEAHVAAYLNLRYYKFKP